MSLRPQTHYSRGQARRTLLLDAAVAEIAERGLEGITHRSVAARAEVPPSTTGYFFSSMDDLISATITHIADGVVGTIAPLIEDAMGTIDDIDAFADALIPQLTQAIPNELIVQFEAYLATRRRPELTGAVRQIMTAFEEATTRVLSAMGVTDADRVARNFVAVIDGFALHRIAWPRDGGDADALADVLRRLLDSYLPRP